ncbi:Hypothetical_protein [Hexamita inflata]|uniref:Hypothetical_protein n=1 Tax=Hexamita inflata TaxID=28002 RepID=A0ABP1H924_9EUKA
MTVNKTAKQSVTKAQMSCLKLYVFFNINLPKIIEKGETKDNNKIIDAKSAYQQAIALHALMRHSKTPKADIYNNYLRDNLDRFYFTNKTKSQNMQQNKYIVNGRFVAQVVFISCIIEAAMQLDRHRSYDNANNFILFIW